MVKYYYENILSSQNYTAKPNIAWSADMTSFDLDKGKKVHVFFCIDIFTNNIIVSIFRTKTITATEIVKELNKAIDKRLPIKPRRELIIHTDRGSQFVGKAYNNFIKENEGFILPSMSRKASPKDNAVVERFMRTFKEHKINDKTFQEELFNQIELNKQFKGYRKIFYLYVKNLNLKPNLKSRTTSPEQHDTDAQVASMLMTEPNN